MVHPLRDLWADESPSSSSGVVHQFEPWDCLMVTLAYPLRQTQTCICASNISKIDHWGQCCLTPVGSRATWAWLRCTKLCYLFNIIRTSSLSKAEDSTLTFTVEDFSSSFSQETVNFHHRRPFDDVSDVILMIDVSGFGLGLLSKLHSLKA